MSLIIFFPFSLSGDFLDHILGGECHMIIVCS